MNLAQKRMNYQKKVTTSQLNNMYSTQQPQKNYQTSIQGKMDKRAISRNVNNQQQKGSQRVNPAATEMNSRNSQPSGPALPPVGGPVPPTVSGLVPPTVGGPVLPPGGPVPPPVSGPIPVILTPRTFGTVRPIVPGFAINPNIRLGRMLYKIKI